jgi:hypothetical protein
VTPGQGVHYVGSTLVVPGALGNFTASFPPAVAGDRAVTATATDSSANTSEFSPCLTIGHNAASFTATGVSVASSTIPVTITTGPARDLASTAAANKKPLTGRGYLQIVCPPLTTGACTGAVALATTGHPTVLLVRKHFSLKPGQGETMSFNHPAGLLHPLQRTHRLGAKVAINAHDGAKHRHTKLTVTRLTLRLGR